MLPCRNEDYGSRDAKGDSCPSLSELQSFDVFTAVRSLLEAILSGYGHQGLVWVNVHGFLPVEP